MCPLLIPLISPTNSNNPAATASGKSPSTRDPIHGGRADQRAARCSCLNLVVRMPRQARPEESPETAATRSVGHQPSGRPVRRARRTCTSGRTTPSWPSGPSPQHQVSIAEPFPVAVLNGVGESPRMRG
jgi:hypothetical protein